MSSRVAPITPAEELLLLCSRTRLNDDRRTRLRELLEGPVAWEAVQAYAFRHHISALLFHHLSSTATDMVPRSLMGELRAHYFHLAARNLRVVGQTTELLGLLEAAGTPGVLWKGPALAYTVYPSPELRTFTDADIIVRRSDVPEVRRILEVNGFLPRPRLGVSADELFRRRGEVVSMWSEDIGIGIDVHWGSTGRYLSPVMDCEQLWRRDSPFVLDGKSIRILKADWMVLALCAHGAKHGPHPWPALKWVTDIEAFLHTYQAEWWTSVHSLGSNLGAGRMLLLGIALAQDLLEAPVPDALQARIAKTPEMQELLEPVRSRALAPVPAAFPFSERLRFDLTIRERLRDRMGYLATRVVTPGKDDLAEDPSPHRAFGLVRRVIRLVRRYVLYPSRGRAFLFGVGDASERSKHDGRRP